MSTDRLLTDADLAAIREIIRAELRLRRRRRGWRRRRAGWWARVLARVRGS